MRLRHIEIFFHIYQEGTISGAARILNVSQPSVSKTLRHAEDQLGFPLFERIKGRLRPTSQADELFVEVSEVYGKMASFDRTAANIRNRSGGHIRLGALPSLGFAIVPRFIAHMRQSNRELSFDASTLHTEEISPALVERRHDICLGFGNIEDERVSQRHIGDVELVLLSLPGSLPDLGDEFDFEALHGQDFVGLEDSGPVAEMTKSQLEAMGVVPKVVVTAHTHYVAASLVRMGVGSAIVDEITAQSIAGYGLTLRRHKDRIHLPFTAMHLVDNSRQSLVNECISALEQLSGEANSWRHAAANP